MRAVRQAGMLQVSWPPQCLSRAPGLSRTRGERTTSVHLTQDLAFTHSFMKIPSNVYWTLPVEGWAEVVLCEVCLTVKVVPVLTRRGRGDRHELLSQGSGGVRPGHEICRSDLNTKTSTESHQLCGAGRDTSALYQHTPGRSSAGGGGHCQYSHRYHWMISPRSSRCKTRR